MNSAKNHFVKRIHLAWFAHHRCAVRGCQDVAQFNCGWNYFQPRVDQDLSMQRKYCQTHAQAFAARHDLKLPER